MGYGLGSPSDRSCLRDRALRFEIVRGGKVDHLARSTIPTERPLSRQLAGLGAFAFATVLVSWLGSVVTTDTTGTEWFRQLEHPAFYPPGATFGIVWTVLYVMIAAAG